MHCLLVGALVAAAVCPRASSMSEGERLAERARRGYTWPPAEFVPPTPGWTGLMRRRERQIRALPDAQSKWDGWTTLTASAMLVQNYTKQGYQVARAPDDVNEALQGSLRDHLATARFEDTPSHQIDVIKGDLRPHFIDQRELNAKILHQMQPMFEEWSGVKLRPAIAYGLRVYSNGSSLLMHVDKMEDHVISAILHVAHEYDNDNEPWPLVIEGFDGTTQEVNLMPGDLLFYESAKCMHGRPRPLKGNYYSSLFMHYYPVGWTHSVQDAQYAVPQNWLESDNSLDPPVPALQITGTGFSEPGCEAGWCALQTRNHRPSYATAPARRRGSGGERLRGGAKANPPPSAVPDATPQGPRIQLHAGAGGGAGAAAAAAAGGGAAAAGGGGLPPARTVQGPRIKLKSTGGLDPDSVAPSPVGGGGMMGVLGGAANASAAQRLRGQGDPLWGIGSPEERKQELRSALDMLIKEHQDKGHLPMASILAWRKYLPTWVKKCVLSWNTLAGLLPLLAPLLAPGWVPCWFLAGRGGTRVPVLVLVIVAVGSLALFAFALGMLADSATRYIRRRNNQPKFQ